MVRGLGKRNGYSEEMAPPGYSRALAFRAAAADWPRVRKILAERVAKAQSALAAFEGLLSDALKRRPTHVHDFKVR